MANARIEIVGPGEIPLLTQLYNEVFVPSRDEEYFARRYRGRYNVLMLVAALEGRPVGFATGFELKPTTFFSWLCGVVPDARRMGIASQLLQAEQAWAREHHYETIRMECYNKHRPMLHFAIAQGYDTVGLRWDRWDHENLVVFEKDLAEPA